MALLSDSQAEFTKDIIDQLSEKDLDNLLKVLGAETQEKPTEISDTYYDLLRLCKIVKFVFDTGCSTTLTMPDVHNMLINQRDSRLSISLAHGKTSVSAAKHGQLISYPIGADAAISQPLKIAVDTVPGLNQSLLSFSEFYEVMGYNVHLAQPYDHVQGSNSNHNFSGMYRRQPDTGDWIDKIPFIYDSVNHQWIVELVISKDGKQAKSLGDILTSRRFRNNKYSRKMSKAMSVSVTDVPTVHALLATLTATAFIGDGQLVVFDEQQIAESDPSAFQDLDLSSPYSVKSGRFRTMTKREIHEALGHFGYLEGCLFCLQVKKSLNRIYKNPRSKHDPRPGYSWHADIVYWSFQGLSVRGYKYHMVLKDSCTDTLEELPLGTRDQAPDKLDDLIEERRNDPRFAQSGYKMFSCFHLDQAGEFMGASMQAVFKKHGINEVHFKDPARKEDAGPAEIAVQQLEIQVKKSMAQTTSPTQYICWHVEHAVKLLNRLPLKRNIYGKTGDGIRPIEQLTNGKINRDDCNAVLEHAEVPGTLALITNRHTKGSDIDDISRCEWGIVLGTQGLSMTDPGHITLFENPYTGTQRATKSFTTMPLAKGQNAWQVLGLMPPGPVAKSAAPRVGDNSHPAVTIVKLPYALKPIDLNESITGLNFHNQQQTGEPVIKMYDYNGCRLMTDNETGEISTGPMAVPAILEQLEITSDPQIDFNSYDYQCTLLQTQPKSFIHREVYQYFEIDADPAGTYMGHVTGHEYVAGTGHQWQIKFPAIGNNQEHVCVYDENEMQNYCVAGDSDGVITATNIERLTDKIEDDYLSLDDFQLFVPKKSVSFTVACDGAGIPKSDRRLYFNWLRDRFGYGPIHSNHPDAIKFDDPFLSDTSDKIDPRGPKFKPGTRFPKPAGPSWLKIKTEHSSLSNLGNSAYVDAKLVRSLYAEVQESLRISEKDTKTLLNHIDIARVEEHDAKFKELDAALADVLNSEGALTMEDINSLDAIQESVDHLNWIQAFNVKAVDDTLKDLIAKHVPENKYLNDAKKIIPPTSAANSLTRDDSPLWDYAMKAEYAEFERLKVHSKPMTLAECRAQGYHMSPVRSHFIFTSKYSVSTDQFVKPKGRFVVDGTPQQMKKEVHYWESYSPAPNTVATRLLQAVACGSRVQKWKIYGVKPDDPKGEVKYKKRFSADVSTAFLHSVLEKWEQFICRLPAGCEVTRPDGTVCEYVIVYRGQYGTPASGFYWTRTRDAWILKNFNTEEIGTVIDTPIVPGTHLEATKQAEILLKERRKLLHQSKAKAEELLTDALLAKDAPITSAPTTQVDMSKCKWKCRQCPLEPCMFIIDNITNGTTSHLLIHVDDIDIVADDEHDVEFILKKMDEEWGITICDPDMLLGVERKLTVEDGYNSTVTKDMSNGTKTAKYVSLQRRA